MKRLTRGIILILNLLAAASLLLAYLAPIVDPSRVILPALFGLAYPYLLMLNLIFISFWLIRLSRLILLSLIVILMGWNHLNNLLPLHFRDRNIPETITPERLLKVLSYNVRGFDLYRWSSDPHASNGIFGFINQQKPDILCFQEYYSSPRKGRTHSDHMKKLAFLPYSAVYFTSDQTGKGGFGIATYSKYPIIKKSRIPFNSSSNAAMYTDILFQRDTFRIFNVHLQSIQFQEENYAFLDTARLTYNTEQIREIRAIGSRLKTAFVLRARQSRMIAAYMKDSPYPVIVIGDFNDTPQSFAYHQITKGLSDAFRKSGNGFGNTYAGELPSFRIDYILYSDPLMAYQFRRTKIDYSDHFPISAWLFLPPENLTP